MLEITKQTDGTKLTIALEGRLDTETAPELDAEIDNVSDYVTDLVFDMDGLSYISSSGLRVLLVTAKMMRDRKGTFVLINVSDLIMETFEMTGLLDILTIE